MNDNQIIDKPNKVQKFFSNIKENINSFIADLKWFIFELIKMYSPEKSFFSKKRVESGIAFIILQWGMIYYLYKNISGMPMSEMFIWASIEAVMCGYYLNKIQGEKFRNIDGNTDNNTETTV